MALPLFLTQCKKLTEDPECIIPTSININNITNTSVEATWGSAEAAEQYLFEYRKVGTSKYEVVRVTSGTTTKITGLEAGVTYEYRVQSNCAGSNSNYSPVVQFTTTTNNKFFILNKWRIKFLKENNVAVSLGPNDYMDFKSGGSLEQSITTVGGSNLLTGNWELYSSDDSVKTTLGTTKSWKVKTLDASNFLLIKNAAAPLTSVDSLRMEKF